MGAMIEESHRAQRHAGQEAGRLRILLIEDDPGDAYLVRDFLENGSHDYEVTWVRDIAEASTALAAGFDCALLDLGLPDSEGLSALHRLMEVSEGTPMVVLTGLDDQIRGDQALQVGAQDYLTKATVSRESLNRSIRYAIARQKGEEASRRLRDAELLGAENARLERGLLARPMLHDPSLRWATRYQPGGQRALLGGDFFDAIQLPNGAVRAIVGDVCGHGPDEAALGVALRVAWRALVLADQPPEVTMPALHRVVQAERQDDEIFATVCDLEIHPDRHRAHMHLAGHPSPILVTDDGAIELPVGARGPLLGAFDDSKWPVNEVELGTGWTLVIFTDGIIEWSNPQGDRFETTGLARLALDAMGEVRDLESLADRLISATAEAHGEPLSDDVALLLLSTSTRWSR
jgi:serine phosphatase RsbU (regulator of sigma subunit)